MKKKITTTPSQLSNEECRKLLIEMDQEAKEFWKSEGGNLILALQDNLVSFGNYQRGSIIYKPDKKDVRGLKGF